MKRRDWTPETACAAGCPGRFVNAETDAIERCDACARFRSDREAVAHVKGLELREIRKYQRIADDYLKAMRTAIYMQEDV